MAKATMLKAGGILVATCLTAAGTLLPSTGWLTPEVSRWAFLIAVIGIVIGGVMWFSGRKAQTSSLSKRHILVTLAIIVALIVIITSVGLVNMRQSQESALAPEPPQSWPSSHPSPQEIINYIDILYPYQREEARKDYEGLSVTWAVKFIDINTTPDGEARVQSCSAEVDFFSPSVFFTVDINDYLELKTMAIEQEFIVQGTITLVGDRWIQLNDCYLIFD